VKPLIDTTATAMPTSGRGGMQKTFLQQFESAGKPLQNVYTSIKDYILSLGDDVTENQLKLYVAFKKIRNVVCVEIYQSKILLHLSIDPQRIELQKDFTKDMTATGHYGTGNLQITIKNMEDFEKAKPLIDRAYNEG
jgi:predicted transport protein